jgi:hypothetical protein
MRKTRIAVAVAGLSAVAFAPMAHANQPAVVQTHKPHVVNVTFDVNPPSKYLTPFQITYRVSRFLNGPIIHDHYLHVFFSWTDPRMATTVQDCHPFDPAKQQFSDVSRWFDLKAFDTKTTACVVNQGATAADPHGNIVWYPVQATQVLGHDVISKHDRQARSDDLYFWRQSKSYALRKMRLAGRADKKHGHHHVSVPRSHLRSFDGANGRVVLGYSGCAGWQHSLARGWRLRSFSYGLDHILRRNRCNGHQDQYRNRYIHR